MEGYPHAGRQPFMLGQPPFDAGSREQRHQGEPRIARGKEHRTDGAIHPGRAHTRRRRRSTQHAGETSLSAQQPPAKSGRCPGAFPAPTTTHSTSAGIGAPVPPAARPPATRPTLHRHPAHRRATAVALAVAADTHRRASALPAAIHVAVVTHPSNQGISQRRSSSESSL